MNIVKKYGIYGVLQLIINTITTKIFYKNARIIRKPFYIRGKQFIDLGRNLTTGTGCRFDAFPRDNKVVLTFGNNIQINDYVHIGAIENVTIGNNVLIASKVFITDHNHGSYSGEIQDSPEIIPIKRELYSQPVIIEDNVWIGEFVSELQGVTIGKGSIIGAMSVVTKSIPPYSIAIGSPAKVIKQYSSEKKFWEKI
jgi:lipopolysaccharide O-acetyltransferase